MVWVVVLARVASARERLTTNLDNSVNPIGGTVNQASVKTRFARPLAMPSSCLRSPASRAAGKGSLPEVLHWFLQPKSCAV